MGQDSSAVEETQEESPPSSSSKVRRVMSKAIHTIYVAGPMTGLPDENKDSFMYAYNTLRREGFNPVLPPEMNRATDPMWSTMTKGEKYKAVMPNDIAALAKCDAIFLLPGFENSNGTALELHATDL